MLQRYSNVSEVPLSLAVFLATDTYDHNPDPFTISATELIKPLRQIILGSRVPPEENVADLTQMVSSRMGSAIHDGIERSWKTNHKQALQLLGYPDRVVQRVKVNPDPEELTDDVIPVYLEQRATKQIGRWTISGKFDFVGDGQVEDFKSTSVYTYLMGTNDERYVWQGSIYRWLNPAIITKSQMAIRFLFTDWQASKAKVDPNYPPYRFHSKVFDLKSIPETEAFIRQKLQLIDQYWDAPEDQIPYCNDTDLWRSEPVWKYYKNPQKMNRSTKNFTSKQEAYIRLSQDGNVGVVIEQPGQVTACKYCKAFSVCSQKDALIASGDLVI